MNWPEIIQTAIDAISLGGLYALVALGVALIFSIMRLINFAHGELIMIAAYALVLLADLPFVLMVAAVLGVTVAAALAMERVAFRPIRSADLWTLLITSFALSYLLQNVAILTVGARPKATVVSDFLDRSFTIGDVTVRYLSVATVVTAAVLVGVLTFFLVRTKLGLQMRAAASDFEMARLLGVRANRVISTAFALSGLLAGVAAILLVAQTGTVSPSVGVGAVVVAFVAVIVGGMGSLPGAALGGLLVGILLVVTQAVLPLDLRGYRDAFVFTAMIALLYFRPAGIIAARSERTRV